MEPCGWAICNGGSVRLAQAMEALPARRTAARSAWTRRSGGSRSTADGGTATASCWRPANDPGRRHSWCRTSTRSTRSSSWSASRVLDDDAPPRIRTLALRRDVDVLRVPGAGRPGPVEGGGVRAGASNDASPCPSASRSTSWTTTRRTADWACRRASPDSSRCTRRCSSRRSRLRARRRASASRSRRTTCATAARRVERHQGLRTPIQSSTAGGRSWRAASSRRSVIGRYVSSADRHRTRDAVDAPRRLEPRRDGAGPARRLPAVQRVPAVPHRRGQPCICAARRPTRAGRSAARAATTPRPRSRGTSTSNRGGPARQHPRPSADPGAPCSPIPGHPTPG